jgi:hypothetical protein
MLQKYIAVLLVVMLSGLTAPAFAGDFVNMKLIPQSFPMALANPAPPQPAPTLGATAGTLALALPQAGGSQMQPAPPARPNSGHMTTGGKIMTGIGVAFIGVGAVNVGYGAFAKDPCAGVSGCVSNASTARPVDIGVGSALILTGTALIAVARHHRVH